jgi:hypothetical protein
MIKKAYCRTTLAALTLIILFYKNIEIFKQKNSFFQRKRNFGEGPKKSFWNIPLSPWNLQT